jgi:capsular polysaccharide biosynthesis protein
MDNEIRTEDEISLADIFACLLAKIRLLIVLLLTGCLIGAVFGYLKSYNVVYYGTEMSFFVSPEKAGVDDEKEYVIYGTYGNTVMDTMIRFLSTEKAAEEFVADMELEGLPQKPDPEADDETYAKQVKEYDEYIRKVQNSITFRYRQDAKKAEDSTDTTESKNFIYVELSVMEEGIYDKEFTRELLRQMIVKIPKIVSETMLNPDENIYAKTGCTLVTPLYPMVEWMNESYTLTETIKFAALVGLATLLVACIAVVVFDRLDKRVREVELIEKRFNIPVLGVIPTILSQTNEIEKKGGNK